MGWSSGIELVETVAQAIKKHVADPKIKKKLYEALVGAAQQQDWDCENEAEGIDPVLDKVLSKYEEE